MRYAIRVAGRWDDDLAELFAGLDVSVDTETFVLSADLDQAALHGLLERIRMRGLELLEVRRTRSSAPRRDSG